MSKDVYGFIHDASRAELRELCAAQRLQLDLLEGSILDAAMLAYTIAEHMETSEDSAQGAAVRALGTLLERLSDDCRHVMPSMKHVKPEE